MQQHGMTACPPLHFGPTPTGQSLVATTTPQAVRIEHGLRAMAFTTIMGALLDFQGRKLKWSGQTQRSNAAAALRWLRDDHSSRPFSLKFCCEILDLTPQFIQRRGFNALPGVTLLKWREVRARREAGKQREQWRTQRRCEYCGHSYWPRYREQQCCSSRCAGKRRGATRRAPGVRSGTGRASITFCKLCKFLPVGSDCPTWMRQVDRALRMTDPNDQGNSPQSLGTDTLNETGIEPSHDGLPIKETIEAEDYVDVVLFHQNKIRCIDKADPPVLSVSYDAQRLGNDFVVYRQ